MIYTRKMLPELLRLAKQYPVITLTGPRQSGKTTLCKMAFPEYHYVNLEEMNTRDFANCDPKAFLNQYKGPVIFDEIQRAPNLPSYLQTLVDAQDAPGQFILTGSQQFELSNSINQSLAGRTALLSLLPLSMEEITVSPVQTLDELLYRGFYPRILHQSLNPSEALSFYVSTYIERDIRSLINIKDLSIFERFLRVCASQIGQLVNYTTISNDVGIDQKTVKNWCSALEASYILTELQPHYRHFRKRLTKSRKLYFYDVGLACYLLGITRPEHLQTHPLRGLLFENFIVSECLKHQLNRVRTPNIYFFRDSAGNEVDLIIDSGLKLHSMEIKSSETFSYDFLKGLLFYKNIAQEYHGAQYVIYAGRDNYVTQGTHIFNYQLLHEKIEALYQE